MWSSHLFVRNAPKFLFLAPEPRLKRGVEGKKKPHRAAGNTIQLTCGEIPRWAFASFLGKSKRQHEAGDKHGAEHEGTRNTSSVARVTFSF